MTPEPWVLIVSTKACVATDDVIRRLAARGINAYRLNTEEFPFDHSISFRPGAQPGCPWLLCDQREMPAPTSIWYRRFRTPGTPEGMDEGTATFCRQETRAALIGSIAGRSTRWMSHPAALWQAEFKPYQLEVAAQMGIPIPRTVVTNDPVTIRAAFGEFQRMIAKPTRSGYLVPDGVEYAIYTSQVLEEHLEELESARLSPAIYQELIPKRFDIRVTIIGNEVFAASIDSQADPAASIDWRRTDNPDLAHYRHELPSDVSVALIRLMDKLQLTFGAIDLVQSSNGDYVFLEVNPNGQWLWLDDKLDLGISERVAGWLAQR